MKAKRRMTKKDGREFLKRWRLVNEREREELRNTPVEEKLRQLGSLHALATGLGWHDTLAEGQEEVRQRWQRIRKAYE